MWIFTRFGFYSAACASKKNGKLDHDKLMIRARCEKHLENLIKRFPADLSGAKITHLQNRDYPVRIFVQKDVWARLVGEMITEQTWSNFKDEATRVNGYDAYVSALHRVWGVMRGAEDDMRGIKPIRFEDGFSTGRGVWPGYTGHVPLRNYSLPGLDDLNFDDLPADDKAEDNDPEMFGTDPDKY